MVSFITPTPYLPNRRSPVICATKKPPTKNFRAKSRASRTSSAQLHDLPDAFLRSLSRLIRTHAFTLRVAECLNWPHIRYTGTILPLPPPDTKRDDTIPHLKYPLHSITLPQGLLRRACRASKSPEELSERRLCAVFETYGEGDKRVNERLSEMDNFENDIRNQALAWSDYGQCMRTETDLNDLGGPELAWRGYATQVRGTVESRGWKVLFGVPIAITFSLGVWQIHRLDRKLRLIEDRKRRISSEELSVDDLATHPDPEYHPIRVDGRLIHTREMLVGPRSAPKEMPTAVLQWGGSSGLQVVTPMVLQNGEEILVNRGWIPQRLANREKRSSPAITPHPFLINVDASTPMLEFNDSAATSPIITMHGVVRRADDKNRFTPSNKPNENKWFYIDPLQMHGTPYIIEHLHPAPNTGWPFSRTKEELLSFRTPPSTHITYATTWFSLSAALALITRLRR